MSRTDKTDPLWVRMMDPANRHEVREVHDHRNGICDMDSWNPRGGIWHRRDQYCYKVPWPYRKLLCNCKSCRGLIYGEEGQRRAEWRAERQAWLSGWGEERKVRWPKKYWYD